MGMNWGEISPLQFLPVWIFLIDLSEINFDTTRKMTIFTWREWSPAKVGWRFDKRSDVQIDAHIYVKGRNTHRVI